MTSKIIRYPRISVFSTVYELRLIDITVVLVLRTLNLRKLNHEDIKYLDSVQVIRLYSRCLLDQGDIFLMLSYIVTHITAGLSICLI